MGIAECLDMNTTELSNSEVPMENTCAFYTVYLFLCLPLLVQPTKICRILLRAFLSLSGLESSTNRNKAGKRLLRRSRYFFSTSSFIIMRTMMEQVIPTS